MANYNTIGGNYYTSGNQKDRYSVLKPYDPYAQLAQNAVAPFTGAAMRGVTPSAVQSTGVSNPSYNVNVSPKTGVQNPAGLVPGQLDPVKANLATTTTMATPGAITATQVGAPATVAMPDPYGDLLKVIPGLAGMNSQAGSVISNDLAGRLNPDVINEIQRGTARYGVASGMPGTGGTPGSIANFRDLATLGMTSDTAQQRGLASYGDFLKTIKGTQTVSPETQANIGEFNAGAQNQANQLNAAALNNFAQFNQNLLTNANQWNAGALNQGSQFNAGVGNQANALNVDIANRNSINAAAPDPWLALNYAADLYARNSAATSGKPYTSAFNANTPSGGFGGFATGSPAAGTVDPFSAYLATLNKKPWESSFLTGYGSWT